MPIPCVAAPSPNFDARPKDQPVDILLMHYTGMQTGAAAIARLTDAESRVSSHYTVDEDGTIYSHVPEDCRAWHAGKSYWAGSTDINARSIGIEIVNPGHEFGYRSFPDAQIEAVIALSQDILSRHAVPPERVLGHSDVAPARKQDPGELFPWAKLAQAGIGLWPTPRKPPPGAFEIGHGLRGFEASLVQFGYGMRPDVDVSFTDVLIAFQRHFMPERIINQRRILSRIPAERDPNRVDATFDTECSRVLAALLAMVAEK